MRTGKLTMPGGQWRALRGCRQWIPWACAWISVAVTALDVSAQAASPERSLARVPATWRFAFQRPDLVRYNRVEALSLGVRAQLRPRTFMGPLSLTATARVGVADLQPNATLLVTRETLRRRVSISLFHGLVPIDEGARHFGVANSFLAATIGRDDGDYYRRTGADVVWTPPTASRRWFRVRGFVEHHRSARVETDFAVLRIGDDGWAFRPNLRADRGWEVGASAGLSPAWGTDPRRSRAGLHLGVQAAAGDFAHVSTSATGHVELPLPARLRLDVTAGAGSVWGSPSTQRLWYLGGPSTLRGYDPRSRVGESFGRARGQLERPFSFGTLAVFSDVGWAGSRDDVRWDDALASVGGGLAIVDDLVHLDAAWGLRRPREFRLDLYLAQGF